MHYDTKTDWAAARRVQVREPDSETVIHRVTACDTDEGWLDVLPLVEGTVNRVVVIDGHLALPERQMRDFDIYDLESNQVVYRVRRGG